MQTTKKKLKTETTEKPSVLDLIFSKELDLIRSKEKGEITTTEFWHALLQLNGHDTKNMNATYCKIDPKTKLVHQQFPFLTKNLVGKKDFPFMIEDVKPPNS
jgi:hypothetical protein